MRRWRSTVLRETDEGTALIFAVAEPVGNDMDADGDAHGDGVGRAVNGMVTSYMGEIVFMLDDGL